MKNKVSAGVPKEEIRKRPLELRGFAAVTKGRVREVNKDGMEPPSLLGMARKVLETATSWNKAQGTLARVLRAKIRETGTRQGKTQGKEKEKWQGSYSSWPHKSLHRKH